MRSIKRLVPTLAVLWLLAACESVTEPGSYVPGASRGATVDAGQQEEGEFAQRGKPKIDP